MRRSARSARRARSYRLAKLVLDFGSSSGLLGHLLSRGLPLPDGFGARGGVVIRT